MVNLNYFLNKKRIIGILILLSLLVLLISFVTSDIQEEGYIIDGNSVYWLVENNFKLTATPHTIIGDGCTELILENLGSERTIDIATRFNPEDGLSPRKLYLYNPHNISVEYSNVCNDSYGLINDSWGFCNTTFYNGSWHGEYIEHYFDRYIIIDGNVEFFWNETEVENWVDYTSNVQSTIYNGKNIHYLTNINFAINQSRTVKICMNREDYSTGKAKFDIFMKLSSDTLQEAFDNNRYVLLDPWHDSATTRNVLELENNTDDDGDYPDEFVFCSSSTTYNTTSKFGSYSFVANSEGISDASYSIGYENSYSISLWALYEGINSTSYLFSVSDSASGLDAGIEITTANCGHTIMRPSNHLNCSTSFKNEILDREWHNWIWVFNTDTNVVKSYLDGNEFGSVGVNQFDGNQNRLTIGDNRCLGTGLFEGNIDRVVTRNSVFTATEIISLAKCGEFYCPFSVKLESPLDNTNALADNSFKCNATFTGSELSNFTLNVWNSSGVKYYTETNDTSGYKNSVYFDAVFNYTDTFHWNCFATATNNSNTTSNSNYTLNVDLESITITLNTANDTYFNRNENVSLNCTFEGTNLGAGFLYGDFTGTYSLNYTDNSVANNVKEEYNVSYLEEGIYSWSCAGNRTINDTIVFSQTGNRTFTIDTTSPNLTLNSITTTAGSQTISFNFTAQDINLDTCKYSVYNTSSTIDGTNSNQSTSCTSLGSATTTSYEDYILRIYSTDKAGNENTTTLNFTTGASSGGVVVGGEGSVTEEIEYVNVSLETEIPQGDIYLIFLPNSPYTKERVISSPIKQKILECTSELGLVTCNITKGGFGIDVEYLAEVNTENNELSWLIEDTVFIKTASQQDEFDVRFRVLNFHRFIKIDSVVNVGYQQPSWFVYYDITGQKKGYKIWYLYVIGLITGITLIIYIIILIKNWLEMRKFGKFGKWLK